MARKPTKTELEQAAKDIGLNVPPDTPPEKLEELLTEAAKKGQIAVVEPPSAETRPAEPPPQEEEDAKVDTASLTLQERNHALQTKRAVILGLRDDSAKIGPWRGQIRDQKRQTVPLSVAVKLAEVKAAAILRILD